MKKYKITEETIIFYGITLHRIQALEDIGLNIRKGDLGGFIEKEENLSQDGDAWVSGNAKVSGNAEVYGDAKVSGDAWVSGCVKVINGYHFDINTVDGGLRIGCKTHSYREWNEIINKDDFNNYLEKNDAISFWEECGDVIKLLIKKGLGEAEDGK